MSGNEGKWFRIAPCNHFPLREGKAVEVAGRQLAIFNLGNRFIAIENQCPHKNGPLADGIVSGTTIVCPLHAWKFDLIAGESINHAESGACLKIFPVRMEDGIVVVNMPTTTEEQNVQAKREVPDRPLRWVERKPMSLASPVQSRD